MLLCAIIALHIFDKVSTCNAFYMPICRMFCIFCILLYAQPIYYNVMNTKVTLQNPKYQTCVDACNVCCECCEACCTACLSDQKAVGMMTRCIMITRDCADICMTASCLMSRGSENAKQICNICADICDACAEECEKFSSKMEQCKQCADACRTCAQECHNMAR